MRKFFGDCLLVLVVAAMVAAAGLYCWHCWHTCAPAKTVSTPPQKDDRVIEIGESFFLRNKAGSDGLGLNVQTCVEQLALISGHTELRGFRDWCAQQPGGAWPEKIDRQLREFGKAKGIAIPEYVNLQTPDFETVKQLAANGWVMIGESGGRSRYPVRVNTASMIAYLDDKETVIVDPNFRLHEFVSIEELRRRYTAWVFAFKKPSVFSFRWSRYQEQ